MKKIILKSIPYIIGVLLLNLSIYMTSDFYKQERKYKTAFDKGISKEAETIFLGDSHVQTIENLKLSKKVANLAFGGDGINEMYIKLLYMIKYNKNLKNVFISTEPQIFNNTMSSNSTFLNKYNVKIDDEINVYNKSSLELYVESIPLFNDSYLRFLLNKLYVEIKLKKKKSNKAIDWKNLQNTERVEQATKSGLSDHNSIMTNNSYLETFKRIISLCKANNLNVYGINFPVDKNYINQCKEEDLIKVKNFITQLNLDKTLDYSMEIKLPEYFYDGDHLNSDGVEKLSNLIFNDTSIKLID